MNWDSGETTAVGIDLGGHNVKGGLVKNGKVIRKIEEKTVSRLHKPVIEQIARMGAELGAGGSVPLGVGIPGSLDTQRERAVMLSNFEGWNGLPVRKMIEDAAGACAAIENDANVYALGEGWSGAAKGLENFITLTLGTGIGGGIVVNGSLLLGAHGIAGEPGHIAISDGDAPCGPGCGGKGHLEAYCAADALERRARAMGLGEAALKELWQRRGERRADEFWNSMLNDLGRGVATLVYLFDPEAIILGGGLSRGTGFIDELKTATAPYLGTQYRRFLDLRLSELGDSAPIVGAAACAVKRARAFHER